MSTEHVPDGAWVARLTVSSGNSVGGQGSVGSTDLLCPLPTPACDSRTGSVLLGLSWSGWTWGCRTRPQVTHLGCASPVPGNL